MTALLRYAAACCQTIFVGASRLTSRYCYIEEMSYEHRLRDLAVEAELALPGITGKTNKWAAAVAKARNDFAHGTKVDFSETTVDQLAGIAGSLRWVLSTVLLLNAHVPISVVQERFGGGQAYPQFRSEVAFQLPDVYG